MSVIFIFVDGIGVGEANSDNPLHIGEYPGIEFLAGGKLTSETEYIQKQDHIYKAIDANLDVEGLPQSGTGQTTLFTGENASKVIGKHFGPFPHSGIKPFLKEKSIFHAVKEIGKKPYFLNAYPPIFFEIAEKRNRWSCTTLMTQSADMKLNSIDEVLNGTALTAEIIQNAWRDRLNIDIPKITATDAAQRLLNVVPDYDLVLYEYYLTDKAGHNQSHEDAERVLNPLDEFLAHIIKEKREEDVLVITSDHGNVEDLSTKSHTRNPVPLFVHGNKAIDFIDVESLIDIKNAIMGNLY